MKLSTSNKSIWNIAYPIIFGNMAQTIISITDTAFLGHLGVVELGASMMAGLYYYVFTTLSWGFAMGIQIIIARRLGEGKFERIGVIFEHGLVVVLGLSILMFSLVHFFTDDLLKVVIRSSNIYTTAIQFLDYRHYGIFFVCFNFLFRSLYVGLSNTKCITYSTIIMAVVNVFLDWCLIFGNLNFPKMGVGGAALASVCAEISALIFFIIYTLKNLPLKKYALFQFHKIEGWLMKTLLKLSFPTMLQRLFSFGTWFLFFALIEKMGEFPIAISGIVRSVYMLIMIPVFAFGATTNTLVSRIIGEGKQNEVMPTIFKVLKNCLAAVLPLVFIIMIMPELVAQIYTNDMELAIASAPVLYVVCITAFFMAFGIIYFEAVSGTGNTFKALLIEILVLILYSAYLWFFIFYLQTTIQWVWTSELFYAALIGCFSLIYLKLVKWQNKKI